MESKDGTSEDPYLWLEEVEGRAALDWVRARDAETLARVSADPGFAELERRVLKVLDADDRIAWVRKIGPHWYNFWQDAQHERGLWRRTSPESYRSGTPEWETVIDLDAIAAADGVPWAWGGAMELHPTEDRALVTLSRGGSDAAVVREFDLTTGRFVEGGFELPEAKHRLAWVDRDTVALGTDFGPGSLTDSGYPNQVRLWRRGTPYTSAELLFEGEHADVASSAWVDDRPGYERLFVLRAMSFWTHHTFWRSPDGSLVRLEVPDDASAWTWKEWLLVELKQDWDAGGRVWPAGSLLAIRFEAFLAGDRAFDLLFEPTERTALSGVVSTRDHLVLEVLDHVASRLQVLRHGASGWEPVALEGLGSLGTLDAMAVDPHRSDALFVTASGYLQPSTLLELTIGDSSPPRRLAALPDQFDTRGLEVRQHEAISKDGTRVPYFMVGRKDLPKDGSSPTLLYGYGGFEIALTPAYSATVGLGWLERGGVYVVANIRGGGEFGPRWHRAALRENRHRAYEDFAAVADDLVARGVTRPSKLGAMGGSNGGLLMGNMLTLYPERFGAIVCMVPLLDMRRFHRMLAGASWMAEYGDPDDPSDWAFIESFSPYHNVRDEKRYPPVLFVTSTRDDRVHPGHARKMAALLRERGHEVEYWENLEGGHGAATTNAQRARMSAVSWTFLAQRLSGR